MKKTAFIICLAALFISQWVAANPINRTQAMKNAQDFLQKKGIHVLPDGMKRAPMANESGEVAPLYVFNIGNDQGFVIASGDDRAMPILGYSDKGTLRTDSLPDNVQNWLDFYKAQIKALKNAETTTTSPRRAPSKVVEPMLTSKWDQRTPYNLACPLNSNGKRCVTGCVATAMAQVMYYHRKNSTRQVMETIPGYDDSWYGIEPVADVPEGTVIDWDNMIDDYSVDFNEEQAMAVANLMLYCGISVQMMYGADASGASAEMVPEVLIKYFTMADILKGFL